MAPREDRVDVSIIIVTWNAARFIQNCLTSIFDEAVDVSVEVLVIDNASEDGTPDIIEKNFPQVVLLRSEKNLGFARANNKAAGISQGRHILFLNPDTMILSNALSRLVCILDGNSDAGAAGCKLLDFEGRLQRTCARAFPTPWNQFAEIALLSKLFPRSKFFTGYEMGYWDHAGRAIVECLSGACFLIKNDVFRQISGFDESYFMYAEDIDLFYKLKERGFKVVYDGGSTVLHYAGGSSEKVGQVAFAAVMQHEANYRFMLNRYGRSEAIRYKVTTWIGSALRLSIILNMILATSIWRRDKKPIWQAALRKYLRILLWALGSADWVKTYKPSRVNEIS